MDRHAPSLICAPVAWCDEVEAHLLTAQAFDTSGGMESVHEYRARNFPVIGVWSPAGDLVGAYAVSFDPLRRNLHVIVAGGRAPGCDLTAAIAADSSQRAADLGAAWVSLHTRRPGLIAKLDRHGFVQHGVILRKRIEGAH